jgi:cytochrome c peroxidase
MPILRSLLCLFFLAACNADTPPSVPSLPEEPLLVEPEGPITPLPLTLNSDPKKVALGHRLFLERRLSRDDTIACVHCHALDRYGVDQLPRSFGMDQREGFLNAPSVFNSQFNFRQFWDGRAKTLEEQVDGPLHAPHEMDSSWTQVLEKLSPDKALQTLSIQAYGRPLDPEIIRSALAHFQRTLITPDAPFDRYLRGDKQAMRPEAIEGWKLFQTLGCISCHQGINVGGNMFARLGVMEDYFAGRTLNTADFGLFNHTGQEEDRFRFKVPSLRNVAMTAPYFHDGHVATLEEAVEVMVRAQLGLRINAYERDRIVAFLEALTGVLPAP